MMGGSSDSIDRGGPSKGSQIGKRPSFLKTVVANSVTSRFVDQLNSCVPHGQVTIAGVALGTNFRVVISVAPLLAGC